MESNSGPIAIEHEYATGPRFVARLSATAVRLVLIRPVTIVVFAVAVFGLIISTAAAVASGVDGLVFVVFFALLLVLWPVVFYLSIRRRFSRAIPVGTRFGLGLGESAIAMQGPLANSEVRYSAYRSVLRQGEFVVLRRRQGSNFSLLPAQLLPGDTFDRLSAAIADATP